MPQQHENAQAHEICGIDPQKPAAQINENGPRFTADAQTLQQLAAKANNCSEQRTNERRRNKEDDLVCLQLECRVIEEDEQAGQCPYTHRGTGGDRDWPDSGRLVPSFIIEWQIAASAAARPLLFLGHLLIGSRQQRSSDNITPKASSLLSGSGFDAK